MVACSVWCSIPPLGRLSGDQYLLWDACLVINTSSGTPVWWSIPPLGRLSGVQYIICGSCSVIDWNEPDKQLSTINCFILVLRVSYIVFRSTQWECCTVEVWPRVCSNTVEVSPVYTITLWRGDTVKGCPVAGWPNEYMTQWRHGLGMTQGMTPWVDDVWPSIGMTRGWPSGGLTWGSGDPEEGWPGEGVTQWNYDPVDECVNEGMTQWRGELLKV